MDRASEGEKEIKAIIRVLNRATFRYHLSPSLFHTFLLVTQIELFLLISSTLYKQDGLPVNSSCSSRCQSGDEIWREVVGEAQLSKRSQDRKEWENLRCFDGNKRFGSRDSGRRLDAGSIVKVSTWVTSTLDQLQRMSTKCLSNPPSSFLSHPPFF